MSQTGSEIVTTWQGAGWSVVRMVHSSKKMYFITDLVYNCEYMVIMKSRLTFSQFIIVIEFSTDKAVPYCLCVD